MSASPRRPADRLTVRFVATRYGRRATPSRPHPSASHLRLDLDTAKRFNPNLVELVLLHCRAAASVHVVGGTDSVREGVVRTLYAAGVAEISWDPLSENLAATEGR